MSNKNIFSLTGITVPLAGTEVLPIWNGTTTTKVTVDDLTKGKTVYAGVLIVNNTSGPDTANFKITSYGAGNAGIAIQNSTGWSGISMSGADVYFDINRSGSAANLIFRNGSTFAEAARIDSANNVKFTAGNLVQGTAAKGINFTANTPAAGMTSQLLNWYEEGTWTPTQGANLTVVGAFTSSGTYTRKGRTVFVTGTLTGATSVAWNASASEVCAGLPFAAAVNATGIAFNQSFDGVATLVSNSFSLLAAGSMGATPTAKFSITYSI